MPTFPPPPTGLTQQSLDTLAARDDVILSNVANQPAWTRPGDAPEIYGIGSITQTDVSLSQLFTDTFGRVVRLSGDTTLAPRRLAPVEQGRVYLARYVVQRRTNTTDPSNDSVQLGVAWFDAAETYLSETVFETLSNLTVVSGRQARHFGYGRQADSIIDAIAPDSARYARPFVRVFGPLPRTDVEVLGTADVTDSDYARLSLGEYEARFSTAEDATFDAIAAIPASIRWVGEWDASSGSFPTTGFLAGPIASGDAWVVSTGGTVDGVSFSARNALLSLGTGGTTYAGNWVKLGTSILPVAAGGTGADNASDALTNLGAVETGEVSSEVVTPTGGSPATVAAHLAAIYAGNINATPTGGDIAVTLSSALALRPANRSGGLLEVLESGHLAIEIPPGDYELPAPALVAPYTRLIISRGARIIPTFEPVGLDRATPLIDFGAGCEVSWIHLHLPADINTIRIGMRFADECVIGGLKATVTDYNNNRVEAGSTDKVSGAVVYAGSRTLVGFQDIDGFDASCFIEACDDVIIGRVNHRRAIRGFSSRGSKRFHIKSGYTSSASEAEAALCGRGAMTPGANAYIFNGCADCTVENQVIEDMLEHGMRIGASDGAVINSDIRIKDSTIRRTYGCGLKTDNSVPLSIGSIMVSGLRTEDIGRGLTTGGATRCAIAVRGATRMSLDQWQNYVVNYAHSGIKGLFVESCTVFDGSDLSTSFAYEEGALFQSDTGTQQYNNVRVDNLTSRSNDVGESGAPDILVRPLGTGAWRDFSVTTIKAGTVTVEARADNSSPFTGVDSQMEGRVATATIAASVLADPDFKNELRTA